MIQANINNRWAQLSQGEKAELLGIYTRAGYNDLASIIADYNEFSSGGGIHIKPENRGKFTALKKRTGHSASWFKEHGTPAQKKMAVFALNARKWNHADGGPLGEENEIQVNHIPNWTVFGTDYSTWKPSDIQNIIDWGYTDPESFFGEEGENTRNALSRAGMADSVIGDIYANMDPELQSKFGDRYKGTKQRQQEYTGGITNAIDSAGQRIYQIADTVAGFVPGPVGMIDWLGHMGADVAEGEFGKVGKDLALAAGLGFGARALGKGVRYLKGYWDEIGNFGEDTFRAFTDRVPGRVSTNTPPEWIPIGHPGAPSDVFIAEDMARNIARDSDELARQYKIQNLGGGYMLKSLMRGNPLEKQLSKNGTVNVNNIKALIGKGSKVEQDVVDKVLASEEFAGKKSIDYNKFRKAVQDELITYERKPDRRFQDYGLDRIGVPDITMSEEEEFVEQVQNAHDYLIAHPELDMSVDRYGDIYSNSRASITDYGEVFPERIGDIWSTLDTQHPEWRQMFKKLPNTKRETYTFSSPRIPNGSNKHYNANTLGHSRTYTTADEPYVLHVMESQSDWAQEGKVAKNAAYVKDRMQKHPGTESNPDSWLFYAKEKIGIREKEVESLEKMLKTGISENGEKLEPHAIKQIKEELLPDSKKRLADAKSIFYGPTSQEIYLSDNFTSRQIQENLRYAAEKRQTKMRYPTRETAAKIEGYPEREAYFDANGKDVSRETVYTYGEKEDAEIKNLLTEREGLRNSIYRRQEEDYIRGRSSTPATEASVNDEIREYGRYWDIERRLNVLRSEEPHLKPGITKKTIYDYEDILRKYTEFPKQYKKLFKGADVRIVTDPKGNTWYEVDVPEGYLQQEWAYKNGGKLQQYADFSGFF